MNQLDRLEKRIRALQARKAARAATFERVQGIDPTEHEAAVYHAIHADIEADAHTYYNLPGGRGSCKSSFVSLEIVDGIQKDPHRHRLCCGVPAVGQYLEGIRVCTNPMGY